MTEEQQEVKLRILLAAKRLFARNGYDGTTIRQICKEANSNIALVSYYFGGKENVFLSLFEMFSPMDKIKQLDSKADPAAALRSIIEIMLNYRMEQHDMISIIQQEIFTHSPRLKTVTKHSFPVWRKMKEVLEKGRNQGVFEFNSLDRALTFVMAILIFPTMNSNFTPLLDEIDMKTEDIINDTYIFILRGLNCNMKQKMEEAKM